jgi:hypothetical protein
MYRNLHSAAMDLGDRGDSRALDRHSPEWLPMRTGYRVQHRFLLRIAEAFSSTATRALVHDVQILQSMQLRWSKSLREDAVD